MARQKSALRMKGSLEDINFYKSKDGYLIREKSDIGSKIKTHPAFQRTRENGAEFGRAGKAGKLLRTAFRVMVQEASDGRMISRLVKVMMAALKADSTSLRGERNVADGDISKLKGFEFNLYSDLGSTLKVEFTAAINRATGKLTVGLPDIDPVKEIAAPAGATHFKVVSGAASINFQSGEYETAFSATASIPIDGDLVPAANLENTLAANSTMPLFLMLGIEFFQEVNGRQYPLKSGAFNALSLISTSAV